MRLAELRAGRPQRRGRLDGLWRCQAVSTQGMRHARSHPALGDGEQPRRVARRKRGVEAEDTAATPVALSAAHRERGAEAATVGRLCRGRDDVLAHGNGVVRNVVQSGWRAGSPGGRVFGAESAAAVPAKKRRTSQAVPSRRESRSEVSRNELDYIRRCSLRRIYIAFSIDLPVARRGAPGAKPAPHRAAPGGTARICYSSCRPNSRANARPWAAKASFSSMMSICESCSPAGASTFTEAGGGAHAHGARCHAGRGHGHGHHAASLVSPLPSLRDPPAPAKEIARNPSTDQSGRQETAEGQHSPCKASEHSRHGAFSSGAATHKGKRVSALRC